MQTDKFVSITAKGTLQAIPFAGGYLSEIYNEFIDPLNKRREKFLAVILAEIEELKKGSVGINLNDLKNNEQFISILGAALSKVSFTSVQEKLNSLSNVTINAALSKHIDEDLVRLYIELIDRYSVLHLQMVKTLNMNNGLPREEMTIAKRLKIQGQDTGISKKIFSDLESDGILEVRYTLSDMSDPNSIMGYYSLSSFGDGFKKFISKINIESTIQAQQKDAPNPKAAR